MGFFDSLFKSAGNSDPSQAYGGPSTPGPLDFTKLNQNVFFPSNFMGHPGIARGLDNALLALATTPGNGVTAGQNISAAAQGVMGLNSNRMSINLNRQMAPYMAMEPMVKMQGELAQQDYLAQEGKRADAQADYYEAGGRQIRPEPFIDGSGKAWELPTGRGGAAGATPLLDSNGHQLTGHPPGGAGSELMQLIHGEEAEDIARGNPPWTAQQRSNRWAQLAGQRVGDQTQSRINNTPGFMSQATEAQYKSDLSQIDPELNRLTALNGTALITENALAKANNKPPVEQRIAQLQQQRQQVMQRYFGPGQGSSGFPSTPAGPVDIPQPVVNPVMDQRTPTNIGGIPAVLGGGATPADLANALVPPGPQAARPAKPAPVAKPSPAKAARPRITIDAKGNVSVQ